MKPSKYYRIGVTGSRLEPSGDQRKWLQEQMKLLDIKARLQLGKIPTLHHGDCVGVDAIAHAEAAELGWRIIVHPPINESHRAFCKGASKTFRPAKYLVRNRTIIDRISLLLAVPGTPLMASDAGHAFGLDEDRLVGGMSGTWYTVLKALGEGKEVLVSGTAPW